MRMLLFTLTIRISTLICPATNAHSKGKICLAFFIGQMTESHAHDTILYVGRSEQRTSDESVDYNHVQHSMYPIPVGLLTLLSVMGRP
jgi:hypothetical protein